MTHCERVLELLADGEPHTHHELYALHVIAHSRVSDLRRRGHVINHWRDGDTSYYQLVSLGESEPRPEADAMPPSLSPSRRGIPGSGSPSERGSNVIPGGKHPASLDSSGGADTAERLGPDGCADPPEQLSFEVAA